MEKFSFSPSTRKGKTQTINLVKATEMCFKCIPLGCPWFNRCQDVPVSFLSLPLFSSYPRYIFSELQWPLSVPAIRLRELKVMTLDIVTKGFSRLPFPHLLSIFPSITRVFSVFLWSSFWHLVHAAPRQRAASSAVCRASPSLNGERRRSRRANGPACRPPLRRCTSWWQCWESVWRGGWSGLGTGPGIPPPWVPSAAFGRTSGICCLPLEAACGSPLQCDRRRKSKLG